MPEETVEVEYTLVAAVSLEDRRLEWWESRLGHHVFSRSYRPSKDPYTWKYQGFDLAEAWGKEAANTTWQVLLDKHAGPMFT